MMQVVRRVGGHVFIEDLSQEVAAVRFESSPRAVGGGGGLGEGVG